MTVETTFLDTVFEPVTLEAPKKVFELIPPGRHTGVIKKAVLEKGQEETLDDTGKKAFVKPGESRVKLTVYFEEFKRTLFCDFFLVSSSAKAQDWGKKELTNLVAQLGLTRLQDLSVLLERKLSVTVKNETYQGKSRDKIAWINFPDKSDDDIPF